MSSGGGLGDDEWRLVLVRLPPASLARVACVCRCWARLAGDRELLLDAFRAAYKLKRIVGCPSSSLLHSSGLHCFAISHPLQRSDSVVGLAVRYQVQVAQIRRLNNMMSDHGIHSRERLLIPVTNAEVLEGQTCYIEMDVYSRRQIAVVYLDGHDGDAAAQQGSTLKAHRWLKRIVFDSMKNSMKLDDETARYYLSLAGGDFRTAVDELRRDMDWENAQ